MKPKSTVFIELLHIAFISQVFISKYAHLDYLKFIYMIHCLDDSLSR
jgi:hypothetical protein